MLEVILVTIKSSVKSSEYSSVKTDVKILTHLKKNPHSTIKELVQLLDITSRGVEKQIDTLKNEERLKRVGSARKGHWEVLKTP